MDILNVSGYQNEREYCGIHSVPFVELILLFSYPYLFVISIDYDAIPYLMSSSFYSILSVSSVVVQFIGLHHTYAHKLVLSLGICFTYLVSISHTVLVHITCVYSLPEGDSSLLYPITVSLQSALIEGSSHAYKTRLPASSQIVNQAIFTAFVLRYCSGLLVFHRWLTRSPPLTHTLFHTTLSSPSYPL